MGTTWRAQEILSVYYPSFDDRLKTIGFLKKAGIDLVDYRYGGVP